jgi:hypothetical protein
VSIINRKFDQDMLDIMEAIVDKLKEKYISPFEDMIKSRSQYLEDSPAPEIDLLNALKPFVDDKCCNIIDKLISSYNTAAMAKIIIDDLQQSKTSEGRIDLANIGSRSRDLGRPFKPGKLAILIPLLILFFFNETH